MQTLGLASEQQSSDGMFKRLFWPTIQNQYDVDLVGQQGFWVCVGSAVLSALALSVSGHLMIAILVGATYFLAGIGVRERSIAAASLIFLCFLIDKVSNVVAMTVGASRGAAVGNPLVVLVVMMLLASNVRATILSRRWRTASVATDDEMPERSTTSSFDKVANRMPTILWPKVRFAFYPLASLLLLLLLAGTASIAMAHKPASNADSNTRQLNVEPQ